jgi:ABC-type polar amino acid transport system ATPase subunit
MFEGELIIRTESVSRVVFMDGGRVVEAAPPAQFFSAPQTDRAKLFLSQVLGH